MSRATGQVDHTSTLQQSKHRNMPITSTTVDNEQSRLVHMVQTSNKEQMNQVDNSICQLSESSNLVTKIKPPSQQRLNSLQVRD